MSVEALLSGHLPRFVLPARAPLEVAPPVDVLVIGAGVAGLSVALSLPRGCTLRIVMKGRAPLGGEWSAFDEDGSTGWAQGGLAAVVGADDSPALHLADTLAAGAGLCDEAAVVALVEEAPAALDFLLSEGVRFDAEEGLLARTREGGHSRRRVVHAGGDATGREIMRGLLGAAHARELPLVEETHLVDLLTDGDGRCCGALVWQEGRLVELPAGAVVLATGGFGRLYAETTSPMACTGDGLAAALRAGAACGDLEFVQFHPTALRLAADPRPLASEALRGEGAVLRDAAGEAVMAGIAGGDLAARDVVSRTMAARMAATGVEELYLDARPLGGELARRFPNFVGACRAAGLDPLAAPVPVAPAVHYSMGGVRTDLAGRSTLTGCYAVGEAAHSGVHGANRLASNSLVEGVVFGRRVAAALTGDLPGRRTRSDSEPGAVGADRAERAWLRREMTRDAGVLREGIALDELAARLGAPRGASALDEGAGPTAIEEANLLLVARALVLLARRRTESRGAHFRADAPEPLERWRCHQLLVRREGGELVVVEEALAPACSEPIALSSGRSAG